MPRTDSLPDDGEPDEGPEDEGYEAEYHPEAEDAGDLWCPKCSAVMYADSTRCPSSEEYVTPGAKPVRGHPWWIWLGLVLLVLAAIGMGLALARS
jgi:hypothetical protein